MLSKIKLFLVGIFSILILLTSNFNISSEEEQNTSDKAVKQKITKEAVIKDFNSVYIKGADWLISKQKEDGSWGDMRGDADTAITGLAVRALALAPKEIRAKYEDNITSGVRFLLSRVQADGKIIDPDKFPTLTNYKTSIAIAALSAADKTKYAEIIKKAMDFLLSTQWTEKRGINENDKNYGGFDYDEKTQKPGADLSNVSITMDALNAAGLDKDSDAYKKALVFLSRCQNSEETNTWKEEVRKDKNQPGNDGGFIYAPEESKAGVEDLSNGRKGLRSYGSMTYAGLKSMIYASLDKDDPRVKAAMKWIRGHYTLDENPELGKMGWFYYFNTFSSALAAYGDGTIIDTTGKEHKWANELVYKLSELQQKEGFWINKESRWWEDFAPLATTYALLSLDFGYNLIQ